jgi:hypothetical protein
MLLGRGFFQAFRSNFVLISNNGRQLAVLLSGQAMGT